MPRKLVVLLTITLSIFLFATLTFAQDENNKSNIGFPENGVFSGSNFDNVQLNNGNLHIEIPLYDVKGRGPNHAFLKLAFDTKHWSIHSFCHTVQGVTTCGGSVQAESGSGIYSFVSPFGFVSSSAI